VRSRAAAILWEFHHRHRWGLLAVVVYLVALAVYRLVLFEPDHAVDLDDAERMAIVIIVPLGLAVAYLLAVFSFGFSGDLAARPSIYPTRWFTLPVTSNALAGWPMLFGAAAIGILWLATRALVVWPPHIVVPWVWPVLLGVVLLGWTQALMWMPYGLPGVRVVAGLLCLVAFDTAMLVALELDVSEGAMLALLAPFVPLAYVTARVAVRRARQGEVPDWRGALARAGAIMNARPRRHSPFPSAARAQAWFEWRLHGRALPASVAMVLPFELALLWFGDSATPAFVIYTLFGVLLTPPLLAAFAAPRMRSAASSVGSYGLSSFTATRPVTGAALIAAKLKMTLWSTGAAWLLVLVAIPLGLLLSDTWSVVFARVRRLSDVVGSDRAVVLGLLVLGALVTTTWKQLVQSLYIGLSGRAWLVKASVFLGVAVLAFIEPIALWIHDNGALQVALWNALPWMCAGLVAVKLAAAAWVITRLHGRQVLTDRPLVVGAASWLGAVLALYGVLVWWISSPLVPRYLLLLMAILFVPLARLSAAPLALAWNRHR
jgi:hypothetical protein